MLLLLHNSSLDRGGVRTRGEGTHRRGTRHTYVLKDAPLVDLNPPPIKETPITPMEGPSTLPIVPLVASPPQPIEAILVDEELGHKGNDDQRGQKNDHGRGHGTRHDCQVHREVHVSPIEPIVEHAYHGRPQLKRKTLSCGTH